MSLKEKVELWQSGVANAAVGKFEDAVDSFTEIPEPSARIYFNISSAFLRLGDLENAERNLDLCVQRDPHMALGFFQKGCLCLQKQRFVDALKDFQSALTNLRGNLLIDYKQLGLQYKLYSCEIMYNRAYAELQLGRRQQCLELLESGKELASGASESRQRIISSALDNMREGKSFLPYRLPKSSMWFLPPRNKTDVLKPVNFLKPAKVLSSIVDQDEYTGFVGVQEKKSRSPSPQRRSSPPSSQHRTRAPKPTLPPPAPSAGMRIESRRASLLTTGGQPLILPKRESSTNLFHDIQSPLSPVGSTTKMPAIPENRPTKPRTPPPAISIGRKSPPKTNGLIPRRRSPPRQEMKSNDFPPAPRANQRSPRASPVRSPTPTSPDTIMTVKVHYTTTRAVRVLLSVPFNQLAQIICSKFGQQDGCMTLWYKVEGELKQITSDEVLKVAIAGLEDGFRLTLWAYEKNESEATVLKEVQAVADYTAQYEDELTFHIGDVIQITLEINTDWYEGRVNGSTGIFPRSFVCDT